MLTKPPSCVKKTPVLRGCFRCLFGLARRCSKKWVEGRLFVGLEIEPQKSEFAKDPLSLDYGTKFDLSQKLIFLRKRTTV